MKKDKAVINRNIVHVPVTFEIFIQYPPLLRSPRCVVIFEPDVRLAFLQAVSSVLLFWTATYAPKQIV